MIFLSEGPSGLQINLTHIVKNENLQAILRKQNYILNKGG